MKQRRGLFRIGEEFHIDSTEDRDLALMMQKKGFVFAAKCDSLWGDTFTSECDWQFNKKQGSANTMTYKLVTVPDWYREIACGEKVTQDDANSVKLMMESGCRFMGNAKNNGSEEELFAIPVNKGSGWIRIRDMDIQLNEFWKSMYVRHSTFCGCGVDRKRQKQAADLDYELSCLCKTALNSIAGGVGQYVSVMKTDDAGGTCTVDEAAMRIVAAIKESPMFAQHLKENCDV